MPVDETTIRRKGVFYGSTVGVLKWYAVCTIQVMTVRPLIEEETVERLNEKVGHVMAVDPESVGVDKKIGILIDEYESKQKELRTVGFQQNDGTRFG